MYNTVQNDYRLIHNKVKIKKVKIKSRKIRLIMTSKFMNHIKIDEIINEKILKSFCKETLYMHNEEEIFK